MGKLHSIRKAIEKNPKIWKNWRGWIYGATRNKKNTMWVPTRHSWNAPYRNFVKSVLKDLGE